ncbi:hypothetical protein TNCV_4639551 [Trichonephila clavipes]|nr:hypothetical protein TNCV_4639551 [Trichonephila clavipes]
MRVRAYCAHPSIRDHWALKCMSRCLDQVVSLKRDPQCLSPQTSLGLGSNPGGGMHVCKCIVLLRHRGTLNSHQAASLLVRLEEGEERWEVSNSPPGFSPSKLGWNRAKSYCYPHGARSDGQRQSYNLPLDTMNFLDLDLMLLSIRWHKQHQHNLGGGTGKILRPSSVALKSKNQEINRLQLAVKLPWAIFFESVDILS